MGVKSVTITVLLFIFIGTISLYGIDHYTSENSVFLRNGSGIRIQVLTSSLIRIQKKYHGSFPDTTDLGVINLDFPLCSFAVRDEGITLQITTNDLEIVYSPSLQIESGGISGRILSGNIPISQLHEADNDNLGGVLGSLDTVEGHYTHNFVYERNSPKTWIDIPPGLLSRRGWTVLRHNYGGNFEIYESGEWFDELFLFGYGRDYKKCLEDFTLLAGKAPLLPLWALGTMYSRWKDYSHEDYKEIVRDFRTRDLPIDSVILDMNWHTHGWYGLQYDTTNFPDMPGFHNWCSENNVRVGFNHHPGKIHKDDENRYDFCSLAGIPFNPHAETVYDLTNQQHADAFETIYLSYLFDDGFDLNWIDNNGEGLIKDNYFNFAEERTGERPVILCRNGGGGPYILSDHRQPIGFSGDTWITWDTLKFTIENTITAMNNLVMWSHDTGGFMSGDPTGEMFARWIQANALSPSLWLHASIGDDSVLSRLPWEWGENVLKSAQQSFRLRYTLIPYIYTQLRIQYDKSIPAFRGMYFDYPGEPEAYRYDQYQCGPDIITAPIVRPSPSGETGLGYTSVWIPPGEWYDYFSGQIQKGPETIQVSKPLTEYPVYFKTGKIIPMSSCKTHTDVCLDPLIVEVCQPTVDTTTTSVLYEDDGISVDYDRNNYRWVRFDYHYDASLHAQKIVIYPAEGSFPGQVDARVTKITIRNADKPGIVTINGISIKEKADINSASPDSCWNFNSDNAVLSIQGESTLVSRRIEIICQGNENVVSITGYPANVVSGRTYSLTVEYSTVFSSDIVVNLFDDEWTWYGGLLKPVTPGSGRLTFDIPVHNDPVPGNNFFWLAELRPEGEDWTKNMSTDKKSPVSVENQPEVDTIMGVSPRELINNDKNVFTVTYGASRNRSIVVDILDANWSWIANGVATVSPGSGTVDVAVNISDHINTSTCIVITKILPLGAPWYDFVDETINTGVPVIDEPEENRNSIVSVNPLVINKNLPVTYVVGYTTTKVNNIVIDVLDAHWSWVGNCTTRVFPGSGTVNLRMDAMESITTSTGMLVVKLLPLNANWDEFLDEVINYEVPVILSEETVITQIYSPGIESLSPEK